MMRTRVMDRFRRGGGTVLLAQFGFEMSSIGGKQAECLKGGPYIVQRRL